MEAQSEAEKNDWIKALRGQLHGQASRRESFLSASVGSRGSLFSSSSVRSTSSSSEPVSEQFAPLFADDAARQGQSEAAEEPDWFTASPEVDDEVHI